MRINKKQIIFQFILFPFIFSHPIDYENKEKEKPLIPFKQLKSRFLNLQQVNYNGGEELSSFRTDEPINQHDNHLERINILKNFQNKFSSIYKYSKKQKIDESNKKKQKPKQIIPEYIPDHYIVIFKKNVGDLFITQHIDRINSMLKINQYNDNDQNHNDYVIKHIYNINGFRGYYGKFDENTLKLINDSSEVLTIEKDQKIKIQDLNVQNNAPWNLSRISRRQLIENEINKDKYLYQNSSGKDVTVYVIDTGINIHHVEFGGRAILGGNYSEEIENDDLNGHGTHVAGIIGGSIYGVAKKVNLVSVKVVNKNGEGSLSSVIQGIEFAINDHIKRKKSNTSSYPVRSIINSSLGGPLSVAMNRAIDTAVHYGINVVAAAGNENEDACHSSPASSTNAITVAATNSNDEMATYSNHGNCVNVFAPGEKIESAWIGSTNNLINVQSGTSMACPHVSGVVALLLDTKEYANYTPEKIKELIEKISTKNLVKKIPIWSSTPNRLIYSKPPVKGTKYSDNDKMNDSDPDDLNDIIDDDDDKPDDLDDIVDDDDDKPDDLDDIVDDDDDKPDDLDDIVDDDDDNNKDKDKDKDNDDIGDIIDDDDDDGGNKDKDKDNDDIGDIIDDDDDDKDNDDIGDIIDDDDDDGGNKDKDKDNDDIGDIIDDDDDDGGNKDKDNDDIGDIIDDDDDDGGNKDKDNDDIGDIIDDDDELDVIDDEINDENYQFIGNHKDERNIFRVKKPLRKDKTYIIYHYAQMKKEYKMSKMKNI
ncbi:subtilisin-like protein [Anaeromyces robustus]|uniref:Subtilisin-like protein n=1 Tax=Anaeromyces robustus TaxID=1754192 RepID=A0A1Y1XA29_9FUNG|nr:subtilisin-like protein [Anaeromyces robustus]|eukprot:ORX82590.1 subtilisin-like protein [Anaeromyces robustus]